MLFGMLSVLHFKQPVYEYTLLLKIPEVLNTYRHHTAWLWLIHSHLSRHKWWNSQTHSDLHPPPQSPSGGVLLSEKQQFSETPGSKLCIQSQSDSN